GGEVILSHPMVIIERMFGEARRELERAVKALDPDVLAPADSARLLEEVACIERLVVAAKTLLARRAAESGRWRAKGDRSPAHWLARTTGTSVGQARATLETAERLRELPATEEALRAGKLSATQASVITDAASADPGAEGPLLE